MALTTAGRNAMASRLISDTTTPEYDNSNAHIGVGIGVTAFSASQTDLVGASKLRKGMDSGFPTIATNVITFQSTFGVSEANFAWAEWGVFNALSGGTMLNRLVEANGTKLSGQTWVFQVAITINIGA